MPYRIHHITAVLLLVTVTGWFMPARAQDNPEPGSLPRLADGQHTGVQFYGSGYVPEDALLNQRMEEAIAQGMTAFSFYVDWQELEPEPGVYRLDELEETLNWLDNMEIQPLLNITMVDIDFLSLPDDLLDPDSDVMRPHVPFDDPQMQERLFGLLDEVVPLLVEYNGFALLLGNEVRNYFETVPDADLTAYARLVDAARTHIHSIDPQMAVGVTLTTQAVLAQGTVWQTLQPVTDILPFNFYPLETDNLLAWFNVLSANEIRFALEDVLQHYGDNPVIIQELGCPSAEANASSEAYQAECFEILFNTLREYPNVRYTTVFTLFDLDETTCDVFIDVLGSLADDLPDFYAARWRGYLCTLGILTPDYAPKPAWDVFLNYAVDTASARP